MASLTDSDLRIIRSWVGEGPPEEDLEERYERLGSVKDVVVETLRAQLSSLLESPSNLSTPDGLSISFGENIRALQAKITAVLEGDIVIGTQPSIVISKLVRRPTR